METTSEIGLMESHAFPVHFVRVKRSTSVFSQRKTTVEYLIIQAGKVSLAGRRCVKLTASPRRFINSPLNGAPLEVVATLSAFDCSMNVFGCRQVYWRNAGYVKRLAAQDRNVKITRNTRNFGHIRSPPHALLQARGEAVISIVADLQDPPEGIEVTGHDRGSGRHRLGQHDAKAFAAGVRRARRGQDGIARLTVSEGV